jgi:hypothetical protein
MSEQQPGFDPGNPDTWIDPPPGTEDHHRGKPTNGSTPPPPDDTAIDVIAEIAALGPNITPTDITTVFNRRFAVANEGGKAVVIWPVYDPVLNRVRHERASFDDFQRFYQNHRLSIQTINPDNGNKKTVTKSYAGWWLIDEQRQQYLNGVVFDPSGRKAPGVLNLWRGWPVRPEPGNWSLMQDHIRTIICGGRESIYDYVIRWLAHLVQKPYMPAEVAIVLRGLKGTGKGIFGKWLVRLCGQHGLHIMNAAHLTGKFAGHLLDAIFVFCDEAFAARDKQHESILKALITELVMLLEPKYRTPAMTANTLHLLMSSNADWVIPASHDERRYLMLDVLDDKKGDVSYFAALNQQMEQGGLAAMLYDLLHLDLGDFHPRAVPTTPELAVQKLHSLDTPGRWCLTVLDRGFVWRSRHGHPDFLRWGEFVSTELLAQSYRQWCNDNRASPEPRTMLGKFLTKIYRAMRPRSGSYPVFEAETVDPQQPHPVVLMERPHGYRLGRLDAARAAFAKALELPPDALPWARKRRGASARPGG